MSARISIKRSFAVFALMSLLVFNFGCYYDSLEEIYPTTFNGECSTDSITYTNFIGPFISERCLSCHQTSASVGAPPLGTYMNIRSLADNSDTVLLKVLAHASGYSAMPPGGTKIDNCSYSKVEAWVKNGMPQN
ncbi:MAG: hypothetical protein RL021_794 [Bacteroidota bacterium]